MNDYVTFIGDVHGCFQTLKALFDQLPLKDNRIILLGDLINKGEFSYQAIEWVRRMNIECLMGNHEYYCIKRHQGNFGQAWYRTGGVPTIKSIKSHLQIKDDKQVESILTQMASYFSSFPTYLVIKTQYGKELLVSHAGVSKKLLREYDYDLGRALHANLDTAHSIIFNKGDLAPLDNHIQVIGHKPTEYAPRKVISNYFVDSGCVYDKKGMGYLSALMFNLKLESPPVVYRQKNIDSTIK